MNGVAILERTKCLLKKAVYRSYVRVWWSKTQNWGDALNPYLIERISGRSVRFESSPYCRKYMVIGSILHRADSNTIVWGAGAISADNLPLQYPKLICAVRGPRSRKLLIKTGIKCPEVYGDPALLLPRFFQPSRKSRWKVGIIPHDSDRNNPWVINASKDDQVKIIDVNSGIEKFVQDVVSCEGVFSSSLHGLICSDAYGVPNCRIILSDNIIGGDFKYNDYYDGIGVAPKKAIMPSISDNPIGMLGLFSQTSINTDLDALYDSCPFIFANTESNYL